MQKQKPSYSLAKSPHQKLDRSQISPYDVIQMKNYKLFQFRKKEMYPSIRPPVSQCDPEETIAWLSASMQANGLGGLDTQFLKNTTHSSTNQADIVNPCKNRKMQEELYKTGGKSQMVLDWSKITPSDLMRMQNCKNFDFQKCERYPSVMPPVSLCEHHWTAEWLANAVEDQGCRRLFSMENDDVVELWKRSPQKDTLGFYGVGSDIKSPDAVLYNQIVSKCLKKVGAKIRKDNDNVANLPVCLQKCTKKTSGNLILNRSLLESKLTKMPTVQKNLHPSTALKYIHSPTPKSNPFIESQQDSSHKEKPVCSGNFALGRKPKICNPKCGFPDIECTEWLNYREDPILHDKTFKRELELLGKIIENEPKSYDELYSQLVSCFQKEYNQDPSSESFYKCCKRYFNHGEQFCCDADGELGEGGMGEGLGGGYGDRQARSGGDKDYWNGAISANGGKGKNMSVGFRDQELEGVKSTKFKAGGLIADRLREGDTSLSSTKDNRKSLAPRGENLGARSANSGGLGAARSGKDGNEKVTRKTIAGTAGKDSANIGGSDYDGDKQKQKGNAKGEKAAEAKKDGGKDAAKRFKKPAKSPKNQLKTEVVQEEIQTSNDAEITKPSQTTEEGESTAPLVQQLSIENLRLTDISSSRSLFAYMKKQSKHSGGIEISEKGISQYAKDKGSSTKSGHRQNSVLKGRSIAKRDKVKHKKKLPPKEVTSKQPKIPKDCPCEICDFMNQREREPDPPYILEMLREQKHRQLIEYHRRLCHKANELWQEPNYLAPQHKCDVIECEEHFCLNPKIAKYFDRLSALKELQMLLCPKHDNDKHQVLFKVQNLKDRLCWRLNQFL